MSDTKHLQIVSCKNSATKFITNIFVINNDVKPIKSYTEIKRRNANFLKLVSIYQFKITGKSDFVIYFMSSNYCTNLHSTLTIITL